MSENEQIEVTDLTTGAISPLGNERIASNDRYTSFLEEHFDIHMDNHTFGVISALRPEVIGILNESANRRVKNISRASYLKNGSYDSHDEYFKEFSAPPVSLPRDEYGERLSHVVAFINCVGDIKREYPNLKIMMNDAEGGSGTKRKTWVLDFVDENTEGLYPNEVNLDDFKYEFQQKLPFVGASHDYNHHRGNGWSSAYITGVGYLHSGD